MSAKIIDGSKLAGEIKENLKGEIDELKKEGRVPGQATILIGDDPAAKSYVNMKKKVAKNLGIKSQVHQLDSNIEEKELLNLIYDLNNDPEIDGILIQLPLPEHINETRVIENMDPTKDVDGFHPLNTGRLFSNLDENLHFVPCTPAGVMELIKSTGVKIKGKKAVMVGHSNIVGKPAAHLLLDEFATVTVCHIHTKDLAKETKQADILISAAGKANLITEDMVKEDAIVIDVGINKVDGKITGDVDFEAVKEKASYITPVPGGSGPMTIAMLMKNTVKARKYHGV
ncbi:MAG TPA: tetrahydrofolate dehydrogenase/cyclohydrolase catalytic domain-containing protein [Halanaerobiales bacterium]|nr:tetrahydrofolate dehydrogenase/cyclohydrolase catalytic domain-containing protein [Halanaerobiales bacterium]